MVSRKSIIVLVLFFVGIGVAFSQKDSVAIGEDLVFSVDAMPVYRGGEKELSKFIKSQINYPASAVNQKIEGFVYIECLVDSAGVTSDHKVLKGIREDLDQEALRVARLVRFETGAKKGGKHVRVKYTVPVKFELKSLTNYTYQLPEYICASSKIDSIIPYVDLVYKKTQKKEYHQYINEKEIIQEGDSIIHFKFKYPKIIHGEDSYTYNKKKCCIYYTSIYTGKF